MKATHRATPADFAARCFRRRGARFTERRRTVGARSFRRPAARDENAGALSGGGQRASGAGRADGGAIGPAGGAGGDRGPRFDAPVGPGGYAWWYVDAFSEDGQFGLTIIAFIGSVFSPYYAWSGRRDPLNHCAVNVALYGERGADGR